MAGEVALMTLRMVLRCAAEWASEPTDLVGGNPVVEETSQCPHEPVSGPKSPTGVIGSQVLG